MVDGRSDASPAQLDAARAAFPKAGQILMNAEKAATAVIAYVSPLSLHCETYTGIRILRHESISKLLQLFGKKCVCVCIYRGKKDEND